MVKRIKNVTIPKKKFASMLRGMMEDHTMNNAANIRNLQYQNILIFILQKKLLQVQMRIRIRSTSKKTTQTNSW